MEQIKVERINELARLAKQRELTPEEAREREGLRSEYLAEWRLAAESALDNTYIVDEAGNKTKLKAKGEK